ncbi:MAG: hypothetical protein ERJ69_03480 [Aphanocapsa feldmannii 288cV]|nr:MAG: hypothetical protein ERJ69_03480 [Aphanocapsa feldmannii 288cV]
MSTALLLAALTAASAVRPAQAQVIQLLKGVAGTLVESIDMGRTPPSAARALLPQPDQGDISALERDLASAAVLAGFDDLRRALARGDLQTEDLCAIPPQRFEDFQQASFGCLLALDDSLAPEQRSRFWQTYLWPQPEALLATCQEAAEQGQVQWLRTLARRIPPLPGPDLRADAILSIAASALACQAPERALAWLNGWSPATTHPRRSDWLTLRWQAFDASGDHLAAISTLEALSTARGIPLRSLSLKPVGLDRPVRGDILMALHRDTVGQVETGASIRHGSDDDRLAAEGPLALARRLPSGTALREALLEQALQAATAAGLWHTTTTVVELQLDDAASRGAPEAVQHKLAQLRSLASQTGDHLLLRKVDRWLRQETAAARSDSLTAAPP